jgi:hypothetical protein
MPNEPFMDVPLILLFSIFAFSEAQKIALTDLLTHRSDKSVNYNSHSVIKASLPSV